MADLILHPTENEFSDLLSNNKIVLVDFWATWCGPCKMIAPIIEQLANQYEGKVTVAKVDVDKENSLAQKYGVQSIPTILIFKDGNEVAREVGFQPVASYTGILDNLLGL